MGLIDYVKSLLVDGDGKIFILETRQFMIKFPWIFGSLIEDVRQSFHLWTNFAMYYFGQYFTLAYLFVPL